MEASRTTVRLGVMVLAVGATVLLPGCAYYAIKMGHLKDNPMDEAVATGIASRHQQEIRARLLRRFPLGRPVSEIRRYLEGVGARCHTTSPDSKAVVCRYAQHLDSVLRTPLGDRPHIRTTFDFTITLSQVGGRLRGVAVCQTIANVRYRHGAEASRDVVPMKCE
jgi:hypothetical protein